MLIVGLEIAVLLALLMNVACADPPLVFSRRYPSGGFKAPVQALDGSLSAARTIGSAVKYFRCTKVGGQWVEYPTIAVADEPGVDIGDGHLLQLANGDILYSYRHNSIHKKQTCDKKFSIRVAVSRDGGRSWRHHSTVAATKGGDFGLWSSFLLQRPDGTLQCYYDDERSPSLAGLSGHQWITMKTYNPKTGRWANAVTVSRASGNLLSRDGMCSVAEVSGRLVCICEGVQEYQPHRGCLWITDSPDGGRTWSSPHRKLWEPANPDFNALAPWAVRISNGMLFVVFTTDEGRQSPTEASTGTLFQDLKYIVSRDNGASWEGPWIIDDAYPIFFPGACVVNDKTGEETVVVQYLTKDGLKCRSGRIVDE